MLTQFREHLIPIHHFIISVFDVSFLPETFQYATQRVVPFRLVQYISPADRALSVSLYDWNQAPFIEGMPTILKSVYRSNFEFKHLRKLRSLLTRWASA